MRDDQPIWDDEQKKSSYQPNYSGEGSNRGNSYYGNTSSNGSGYGNSYGSSSNYGNSGSGSGYGNGYGSNSNYGNSGSGSSYGNGYGSNSNYGNSCSGSSYGNGYGSNSNYGNSSSGSSYGNGYGSNSNYGNSSNGSGYGNSYSSYGNSSNYGYNYGGVSNNGKTAEGKSNYGSGYSYGQTSYGNASVNYSGNQEVALNSNRGRLFAILAGIFLIISISLDAYYTVREAVSYGLISNPNWIIYNGIPLTIIIALAVLFIVGRKSIGLIIVYGLHIVSEILQLLRMMEIYKYDSYLYNAKVIIMLAMRVAICITFMLALIFARASKNRGKTSPVRFTWFIPAVLAGVLMIVYILTNTYRLTIESIVFYEGKVLVYLFAGIWLRKSIFWNKN